MTHVEDASWDELWRSRFDGGTNETDDSEGGVSVSSVGGKIVLEGTENVRLKAEFHATALRHPINGRLRGGRHGG